MDHADGRVSRRRQLVDGRHATADRSDGRGGHSGIGNISKNIEEWVDTISFIADRLRVRLDSIQ